MLSIAKLRVGQEAYQLSGVAQSLDDYYTGAGEAPGSWAGAGAERLGLDGEVHADDLRAVLAGIRPGTGGLSPDGETIRPHRRRVPGFDLTFKVPKSVSVLYAVSDDPRVQGAIIEAGDTAVRAALAWLEREAIHVRRGTGNQRWLADLAARDPDAAARAAIRVEPASGVVAAMFRHRTSRAGDPLLHWHTLVANLVEGPDGRWTALVHPDLYDAVRPAGEVFQVVLRAELTQRLGLRWRPGRHVAEVAGVPQRLCDLFSKRTQEIDAWLEATGTPDDPAGRQAAVLATRRGKPELEGERFDALWKAEALAAGWGPDAAEALLTDLTPAHEQPLPELWRLPEDRTDANGAPVRGDRAVEPEEWIRDLLRRDLTVEDSTFTRPQLVQAIAARLGNGATMATLERIVARTLASPELVRIHGDQRRWTSRDLLDIEHRFLAHLTSASGTRGPLASEHVEAAIAARPTLGDDQTTAARLLAASSDAVQVLVGPAGTGKTFTLDAIRAAYQAAGYKVIGAAPSARAALELEAGANIPSETMQRLLGDWSSGHDGPDPSTLLVVDEAGMAGIRDLEALVTRTVNAGGRVVLSGDHRQLPEVTAGGGFAAAATTPDIAVAELTINRRQHHLWEQDALVELRDGHIPTVVASYREHGRVIVADDRADMITRAVDRWFDAHDHGLTPVLLASTNELVDRLNEAVRRELIARGVLDGEQLAHFAGRDFVIGDRVVLRRNSYRTRTAAGDETAVLNGQTGTVLATADAQLIVRLDRDGSVVHLDEHYLRAGWIDHGYALTGHRAQGGTWDLTIAVGADGLYREGAYVLLSRGRESNWLIVTAPELADIDAELERHDHGIPLPGEVPDDVDAELHQRLSLSRAKLLALTRDPDADHVARLAITEHLADLESRARYARTIEQRATSTIGVDPHVIGAQVERAQHTASHAAIGQQIKAHDRHNIGTIIGLDDDAGTITAQFISPEGQLAVRDLPWFQVEIVTPRDPKRRELSDIARERLDAMLEPARQRIDAWHRYLVQHNVGPLDAQRYERAARSAIDRAAARLAAQQPDWLIELIGRRPFHALAAHVWDDTIRDIAAHRTRHQIPDTTPGLGDAPIDPRQRVTRDQLRERIETTREWLDGYEPIAAIPLDHVRLTTELEARKTALDAILDTAPPDQRELITALREGDQLSLEDAAELLRDALAAQDERHDWILTHWPHVVEYAEVSRRLVLAPAQADEFPDHRQQLELDAPCADDVAPL